MPWPPKAWRETYTRYGFCDAWYSGDPNRLLNAYLGEITPQFWAHLANANDRLDTIRASYHVPIAGDVCGVSASLLFGETPAVSIPDAAERTEAGAVAFPEAVNAQERLQDILARMGFHNRCLAGAETCAAMGGVVLKINWDVTQADYPVMAVAQADSALPEFWQGRLIACTFHRVVRDDGGTVWRHLERYEPGVILNALYRGSLTQLGQMMPLDAIEETATILPEIRTGIPNDPLCRYVANKLPNRLDRGSWLGQSDFQGAEALMDGLDETYTSWMRDVRLGKGRLIADRMMFERVNDATTGAVNYAFDLDREAYMGVSAGPGMVGAGLDAQIKVAQFAIRVEEHRTTMLETIDRIVSHAGYSPQSFGLKIENRAESGKALTVRERQSLLTRGVKERYWVPALSDMCYLLQQVDVLHCGQRYTPFRVAVELSDSLVNDPLETAQTVNALRQADAASTEALVLMVHPEWRRQPERVAAEVERILRESGRAVPDPVQGGIA
ncbi:MAG: phage portal protein [Rhodospirillaceae bacterium]